VASVSRTPDALLKAAAAGKLATRAAVEKQVLDLLSGRDDKGKRLNPGQRVQTPRVLRFFQEYFGYTKAPEVFKDRYAYLDYDPYVLVNDTDALVLAILAEDKDVLKQLLTTDKGCVGNGKPNVFPGNTPKRAAEAFKTSGFKDGDFPLKNPKGKIDPRNNPGAPVPVPVPAPKGQRAGVLTQPSWLLAHSLNADNHPVARGKWVRERLLGGTIPDIPINVQAVVPEDPHKARRERLSATRADYCWQCHKKMDDLGYPFETFDHFAVYRETELGKPVSAKGAITASGDPKLDGPVSNAVELMTKLGDSARAPQVFVRHAFRYWLGREEALADAAALQEADAAYVKSGGSMKVLIATLIASDANLYRAVPKENRP
jgi:hypothetical protein